MPGKRWAFAIIIVVVVEEVVVVVVVVVAMVFVVVAVVVAREVIVVIVVLVVSSKGFFEVFLGAFLSKTGDPVMLITPNPPRQPVEITSVMKAD